MMCGGTDLDLYVLGQLGSAEVSALEDHLLNCDYCCDELDWAVLFTRAMREA